MDQRDLAAWGSWHGAGVQDRGDGLYPVDEAGARADHEGVCVDGPHRDACQRCCRDHGLGGDLVGVTFECDEPGR